jgi:RNA polymerase sigma-70 factor, ECF subfamily
MQHMDDAELLRRSAAGDEPAFETLYRRHRDAVYRFAYVIMRSGPDAEEVVQDAFVTLNRKAATFDPKRSQLRTWLLGIARNLCYRRMRPVLTDEEALADIPTEELDMEAILIGDELSEAVRKAVMSLPRAQREAIVLFEFEELSLAETADVLGIEPNAVKARLHRGRELLRSISHLRMLQNRKLR